MDEPIPEMPVPNATPLPPHTHHLIMTNRKLALIGLLVLLPVCVGSFWLGRQSVSKTPITVTPTVSPSPTEVVSSPEPTEVPGPPIPVNEPITQKACATVADCYPGPTCSQQVTDMYGNNSHCPVPECVSGICVWNPVP